MPETVNSLPEEELFAFVKNTSFLKNLQSLTQKLLAGDGSGRSFYRLYCTGTDCQTAILLYTPPGIGPKLAGDSSYSQEKSFVELGHFFHQQGIPTPQIYNFNPERSWILMEDVGNFPLYRMVCNEPLAEFTQVTEQLGDRLGKEAAEELFKKAILLIAAAQSIRHDKNVIAYRRFLDFEKYRSEIAEFSDYYAEPQGLQKSAIAELGKIFDGICETIVSFPKALSFFDYNAHNLFVSEDGNLRVLDFQDACLVSSARDIVSLINDRGMDQLLGQTRHGNLLRFYIDTLQPGPLFTQIYNMTLLHWDLRVTGRFIKLNQKFNTSKYQQWIPSTLQRLGRTLQRSEKSLHGLSTLLEICFKLSPEVREGYEDPWNLPEI